MINTLLIFFIGNTINLLLYMRYRKTKEKRYYYAITIVLVIMVILFNRFGE